MLFRSTTPFENAYTINLDPILYVQNDENKRGLYVDCKSESLKWLNITDEVIPTTDNNKGIISEKTDTDIIRYIGYNKVIIKQALSYKDDNNTIIYHSPENKHHFITTGGLGWLNFDEKDSELTLTKRTFKELPIGNWGLAQFGGTGPIVSTYKCAISKDIYIYCICDDRWDHITDHKDNKFVRILFSEYFNKYYMPIDEHITKPDGK